jgi:hypothetical protein
MSLLLAFVSAWSAPAATIVLTDETFSDADWTATVISQTGSLSGVVAQSAAGGNTGAYRRQTFSWPQIASPSSHSLTIASFGPLFFDPSASDGILSIEFEFDLARISGPSNFASTGFYRPYLLQDGDMFVLATTAANLADNANWTPHSHLSTSPSDWNPVVGFGSGSPDFSSSGAPITFGYRVLLGLSCPSGYSSCVSGSVASGLDNFKVTITTPDPPPPTDVPEPSTAAMASLGVVIAVFASRRRSTSGRLLRRSR